MNAAQNAAFIIDHASADQRARLRRSLKVSRLSLKQMMRFFYPHELREMAQQVRKELGA